MDKKRVANNFLSSIMSFALLTILNIFVSQFVLLKFGSEVNGLLSSVTQIFSYIAILEAGIGTATVTALYKPLADKNGDVVSSVLAASNKSYRTSAVWYFICVVIMSVVWPLAVDSDVGFVTIFLFIFLQGISGVITYCFTSSVNNYLVASGKNYINNYVNLVVTLATYIAKLLVAYFAMNIAMMSLLTLLINLVKCAVYVIYAKRSVPEFFKKKKTDFALTERKSFFIHEISGAIFLSTDMIIISVFCSLRETSVYAAYSLPVLAMNSIVGQIFNSLYYILGNAYAEGKQYEKVHDCFSRIVLVGVFILFTTLFVLLLPFVSVYTQGVGDFNYIDGNLPLLFIVIQLLSNVRLVENCLIKISGNAGNTIKQTIAESVINLTVSLVLVNFIGMYGVLIGTIAALLYRTNDIIIYANRRILKRSLKKTYVCLLLNFALFGVFAWLNNLFAIRVTSYLELLIAALPAFLIVAGAFIALNAALGYKEIAGFMAKRKNN